MSEAIQKFINGIIDRNEEVQIGLRGTAQPLGPGRIERVVVNAELADRPFILYRMKVKAQMQATPQSRPANVIMPVVFSADDVVIIIETPVNAEGESAIVTPGGNGRSAGGLHIPGGS